MAARTRKNPDETRLDSDVTKPSTTAPGDGPADTTDPAEMASSVRPDKAAAVEAGHGTVNAVVKVGDAPEVVAGPADEHRIEEYDVRGPDGKPVRVRHNIDTGETELV